MAKVTLKLGELTCPSCLTKIENALKSTKGINSVKVMFNASKVKAEFDEDQIQADEIAKVITGLGYEVKSTKVLAV